MRSDQCSLLMHPRAVQSSTRYFSREQQQQHYKVQQHSENSFNNQNSSPPGILWIQVVIYIVEKIQIIKTSTRKLFTLSKTFLKLYSILIVSKLSFCKQAIGRCFLRNICKGACFYEQLQVEGAKLYS